MTVLINYQSLIWRLIINHRPNNCAKLMTWLAPSLNINLSLPWS